MQEWKEQAQNVVISQLHRDVSAVLDGMGLAHAIEHVTQDGLFSIDLALLDGRVAVEVDGPFHYSANTHCALGMLAC